MAEDRSIAALRVLEARTVDTSKFTKNRDCLERSESRMVCVAYPFVREGRGGLGAYHVSDDPGLVLQVLEAGEDLQERRPWGDLCGGLYLSGCPDYWAGRSRKQWDFMEALDADKQAQLRELILEQLAEQFRTHYVTQSEYENAVQIVRDWERTRYWPPIVIVANQPFNIDIQRLARDAGLADPFKPVYVEVDFEGRYLEFMDRDVWRAAEDLASETLGISREMMQREDVCRALRERGWDGAFTRSSMATNAELVLWNSEAVLRFGDWRPSAEGPAMSGPGKVVKKRGTRFEATIYLDHVQANIIDKEVKVPSGRKKVAGSLMLLEPAHVDEVLRITDAALRRIPWDFVALRRLEARGRPEHGGVQIIDTHNRTMLSELDLEALEDLRRLAGEVLTAMAGA